MSTEDFELLKSLPLESKPKVRVVGKDQRQIHLVAVVGCRTMWVRELVVCTEVNVVGFNCPSPKVTNTQVVD